MTATRHIPRPEHQHIVMFSGGAGSWATGKLVAERYGTDNLILLFADTLIEDEDLYRFLPEAAENIGGQLVVTAEGRTPWQVFKDHKFLGNHRIDPCSKSLKRDHLRKWLEENCIPEYTTVYLGIDWIEEHRFIKAQKYWDPWTCESPLIEHIELDKDSILKWLDSEGIDLPRLYKMGMPHNNCGGGCVKAGQAHFRRLLEQFPERYREWEEHEEDVRQHIGKDVAILTDRSGGNSGAKRKPMTLAQFRQRLGVDWNDCDGDEWGGCGCFSPTMYDDE